MCFRLLEDIQIRLELRVLTQSEYEDCISEVESHCLLGARLSKINDCVQVRMVA